MALTTEQQSQLEFSAALQELTVAQDATRRTHEIAVQAKQAKLEAVRLAKDVLIENARSKAVDSRDVAAADIAAFADILVAYVNA